MSEYDPKNWFWIVGGNEAQAWSSAAGAYLDEWPDECTSRIANEVELAQVLRAYGIMGPSISAQDVKDEARRRILAVYPDWKQANMTARGVELIRKLAQGGAWSQGEEAEATALEAAWDWIKTVRAAADSIELMSPLPRDFGDDGRWPERPDPI